MAVDQVSARSVQALNAAGTQDAGGLREGTQLEGRVLAVNPDASLRLATRYGLIDVDQSQISVAGGGGHGRGRLPPPAELVGTTVKLEVTGQNTTSGRYMVKLVSAGDPALTSTLEQGTATPEAEIAARIAADMSQAAARQDGLAHVFAGARQMIATPDLLPEDVGRALEDLGGLALDGSVPISADDIRGAVSSSGLFLEAKLARWAAGIGGGDSGFRLDPTASLASQDLKAALFSLKSALDGWVASATTPVPAEAVSAEAEPTVTPPDQASASETGSASALIAEAAASGSQAVPTFDTEALFAVLRPPPVAASTGLQTGSPDLVTLATLGEWFQAAGQVPTGGGGRRSAYGGRPMTSEGIRRSSQPQTSDGVAPARPPPPRRGSLPQGQAAVPDPLATKQPLDMARELALKAGNALARVSLGQYASLPDHLAAGSHGASITQSAAQATAQSKSPASWLFEIPLRIGDGTSIAQFEIDQVLDGGSGAAEDGRAWRVQFSLDVAPIGPIHTRLVLADRRLSVGLWAEDRIGATALQRGILALRQSLEAASFMVDEIHFASGRPPSGPPARAGGFIDRNA